MRPVIICAALVAMIGSATAGQIDLGFTGKPDYTGYNYHPGGPPADVVKPARFYPPPPLAPTKPWQPTEYRPINEKHWQPPKVAVHPQPAVSWFDVAKLRREVDRLNAAATPSARPF